MNIAQAQAIKHTKETVEKLLAQVAALEARIVALEQKRTLTLPKAKQ